MGLFSSSKSEQKKSSTSPPATTSTGQKRGGSGSPERRQSPPQTTASSGPSNATQLQPQYRPIFLLVWPSALFKAHWAIFIPDATDKTYKQGKYIHVAGSLDKGFQFEVVRGWDINKSRSRPGSPIEIGWVRAEYIQDTPTNGRLVKESVARDALEAFLAAVPPPTASLNSVSSVGGASVSIPTRVARTILTADGCDLGCQP